MRSYSTREFIYTTRLEILPPADSTLAIFLHWPHDDLECTPAIHLVQGVLIMIELEDIRYHALQVDFTTIEISDGTRETVSLREGTDDLDSKLDEPDRTTCSKQRLTLISSPKICAKGRRY